MEIVVRGLVGAFAVVAAFLAHGQSYPVKPVRIISPAATGGSADASARTFGAVLERRLNQSVVVESRPGANQTIGTRYVVNAPPDGYTLYYGTVINPHPLFNKVNGVEPIKELAPISTIMTLPMVLFMSGKAPASNWPEFLAYARTNPGAVNYASPNAPSFLLYMALIANRSGPGGLPFTTINYKGGADTLAALLSGESQFTVGSIATYASYVQAGTIKPLFVMSSRRAPQLPGVPTAHEVGIDDFQALVYYGFWAPKGTPAEIIRRLNAESVAVVKTPEFAKQVVSTYGGNPVGNSPEECLRDAVDDLKLFAEAAALTNLKPD